MHRKNRHRSERGQAMVESALILVAVLCMIIFILDMGRLLLTQQYIAERARATARAAAVHNWSGNEAANYLVFNNATAPAGQGSGVMGLRASQVNVERAGSPGKADYRITVQVTGVPVLTFIPFMAGTYTAPTVTVTIPAQSLGATT